eukprot:Hpha_TRINITY_DN15176_c0_g12::TRINITY_DN15176_c0_g12_i3::g.127850::m.127850
MVSWEFSLLGQRLLAGVVQHEHERRTHGTERVRGETLVERARALLRGDHLHAVEGALVHTVLHRLLGLHLQTTTHRVERVRNQGGGQHGGLSRAEGRHHAHETQVVLVRVQPHDGVEGSELHTTVRDDTRHTHTETVVQTQHTLRALRGLHDAVTQTVEGLLTATDVRRQTRPRVVQGVHDAQTAGTRGTTGRQVHGEELPELRLRVVLREHLLDGVLERQVERLGGEVTDHVGEVTTPERRQTLLLVDAREAVTDAGVTRHLTAHDTRVGILRLDHQLHTLDRRGRGLGHRPGHTAEEEVEGEVVEVGHFRCR